MVVPTEDMAVLTGGVVMLTGGHEIETENKVMLGGWGHGAGHGSNREADHEDVI